MKIRYYVCGLGYDENLEVIDYEVDFGDFDSYKEAYELFVKLQCRSAESFFVNASEVYEIDIRLEECEETDDAIECIKIRNEWGIINPKFNKEGVNMKIRDYDVSLLMKECADFIYYIDEQEMDNDCSPEEQLLINSVANVLLALNMISEKEDK
jgi:hypothetical protein